MLFSLFYCLDVCNACPKRDPSIKIKRSRKRTKNGLGCLWNFGHPIIPSICKSIVPKKKPLMDNVGVVKKKHIYGSLLGCFPLDSSIYLAS